MKSILLIAFLLLVSSANASPIGNPIVSVHTASAVESSHVLKSTGGLLNSITVTSTSASGYLLIFDATSAPADGAVTPVLCYAVASDPLSASYSFGGYPLPFTNGIVAVFSTTGCFTKTASSTAFFAAQVQ